MVPKVSLDPIPAELQYVATASGIQLTWDFVLRTPDGQHWYELNASSSTGTALAASDWIDHASYKVFARPTLDPDDGSRTTLTDPNDKVASPYGWHDTDGVAGAAVLRAFDRQGRNLVGAAEPLRRPGDRGSPHDRPGGRAHRRRRCAQPQGRPGSQGARMNGFNLSTWALGHRSFVWYLMLAIVLAGALSYMRLGREEDPPFTIKSMVVTANWPGATKAVSEWFPRRESGWAVALFDSGSSIGGALAPLGGFLTQTLVLLAVLYGIRRTGRGSALWLLVGIAFAGSAFIETIASWLIVGTTTGIALLIAYRLVFRHRPELLVVSTGTLAVLGAIRDGAQRTYPAALPGSVAGAILVAITAWLWFRGTMKQRVEVPL